MGKIPSKPPFIKDHAYKRIQSSLDNQYKYLHIDKEEKENLSILINTTKKKGL
jgi:hypothetical protein